MNYPRRPKKGSRQFGVTFSLKRGCHKIFYLCFFKKQLPIGPIRSPPSRFGFLAKFHGVIQVFIRLSPVQVTL